MKEIEILLIRLLKISPSDSPALRAFDKVLEYFFDEDFLSQPRHEKILFFIYNKGLYDRPFLLALSQLLNMNYTLLLEYRRDYLCLFAKYYLGLPRATVQTFGILKAAITEELNGLSGHGRLPFPNRTATE